MSSDRPRIGISACLLGQPVRYDAGHKRDVFLVETFGQHVEWVAVCPEVEAGFGTPRPSMRLVVTTPPPRAPGARVDPTDLILLLNRDDRDVTAQLRSYAQRKAEKLAKADLSGFVLKKDSPSCGMERVKVYTASGQAQRAGRGLFAEALMSRLPDLPVEEEGRLGDPRLRENFVERVFAFQRLRRLFDARWTVGQVVQFHTAHKLTLMAHSPSAYRALGQLVASAKEQSRQAFASQYGSAFMRALATIATPKRHANVMQHMLGYFSDRIDSASRSELLGLIEEHRLGRVPRVVPLTLLRHHVRAQGSEYLTGQTYLDPHPRELALLNHV